MLPETAAPSVGRFLDAFRALSNEGADGVVVVCISSKISATHQAAVLAAEQFPAESRYAWSTADSCRRHWDSWRSRPRSWLRPE